MDVIVIDTPQLGDRSYLVHDGAVALVIDPQRDTDRVEQAAREAGVSITHVAETHIHNDYVTGGFELARAHGASYLVNAADPVKFERTPITDGETVQVGAFTVKAVATPGHTHTHLSFIVEDGEKQAVFSGGSLLYGSVGRTDLVAASDTVGRLVEQADRSAALFPTHGFGSFCSSGPATGADESTIGEQLTGNHALTDPDEDHFVRELIANLTAYPSYYAHMGPSNVQGPGAADLSVPESVDPAELNRRLEDGEWVVDLRNRTAFAAGHAPGTLNFGLDGAFSTYLGWMIEWGTSVTLLGETAEQVAEAQRDMARIGLGKPAAMATGKPDEWADGAPLGSFPVATFKDLKVAMDSGEDLLVLDVRRGAEYDESHIEGAVNVPIHAILAHIDDVPRKKLWVHCAGGYRASVVASILDARGYDVVSVDDSFGESAGPAGLPIVA